MPQKLGKYEIIEELGRGAMGVVYKARDPFIGRLVALKTITTGLQDQPELLQRFYREAQAAGGLQHPNVVTIYDLGEGDGTPYIAMEFLEGEDLEHIISDQRPIPLSQKIGYIVQAARALEYAHKRGVVHRDIKPANMVALKDGTIKVLDFGIARLVDTSRSQTGLLIGTVNYMSPEQVRGERVDGRSDIFSLGVTLYELLTYERPFQGNNFTAVMLAIISQEPKAINQVNPDIPQDVADIVHKFLKKDVGERYQDLGDFLIDVDAVWKRLQSEAITKMVAESQDLVAKKDLQKARDVLRQAVQIDPGNKTAKTALEKINAELKRTMMQPQAQEHVTKGEGLLKEGKLQEAGQAAEAALKLDSVYAPAQELLKKVQDERGKAELVKEFLKTTKQRLAEGDLTAADQSLKKALELEAGSKEAKDLQKQLNEEKVRREKRKKLLDSMQQARNLWTQQQFEECIQLLTGLQKEFPGEDEVTKLLETVREDEAEQTKHSKLAEAKSLLAAQRFADALNVLTPLVEKYKDDPAVQKLHDHIQQERKIHAQRVRLEREQTALRKLVTEEKYSEAISKGEQLVKEFPEEVELARMVDYARSQQAQIDQARRLKEAVNRVQAIYDKGNWDGVVKAADKELESFPGNQEIRGMLDEARAKIKEKERQEYVEKQIRSIKAAMASENHTGAIDLARQTLAVVKHDTDITQLMQFAQRERDLRDQKKQGEDTLKTIAVLAKDKKFDEAKKALANAEKTQVFNPLDPRVQAIMKAVQEGRALTDAEVQEATEPAPAGTIAGQYVFAPGRAVPTEPDVVKSGAKASAQPMPVTPTPIPVPPPVVTPKPDVKAPAPPAPPVKPPVEEPKKKGKPAVEEPPRKEDLKKAKPAVVEPPRKEPPKVEPPPKKEEPRKEEKKAAPAVEAPPKPKVEEPKPKIEEPKPRVEERPAAKPAAASAVPVPFEAPAEKKSPIVMIAIAAVVVIGLGLGVWKFMGSKPGAGTGLTDAQKQTLTQAQQFYTGRQLDEALAKYKELAATGDADVTSKIGEIEGILAKEKEAMGAADAAFKAKNWPQAQAKYKEVVDLNGPRKGRAESQLQTVTAALTGADPKKLEADAYGRATAAMRSKDWPRAVDLLKGVIGMDGANKSKATGDLQVAENRVTEKRLFDEGAQLQQAGQRDRAKAKFEEVVRMNGDLKRSAETRIGEITGAINAEAVRQAKIKEVEDAIANGRFADARRQLPDIGGDTSALLSRIEQGEQQRYTSLQQRVASARTAKNTAELTDLQSQLNTIAQGGGSKAGEAASLAREIPAYLAEIRKANEDAAAEKIRQAEAAELQAFQAAEAAFSTAVNGKDRGALNGRIRNQMQTIADGRGKYSSQASDYVSNRIPAAVKALMDVPCPTDSFRDPARGGLSQEFKAGDVVPDTQLDAKPAWVSCPMPDITAAIRVGVTVNESGAIEDVKFQAGDQSQLNAVAAALKNWKVNPTPKYKNLGVKTNAAVLLRPAR